MYEILVRRGRWRAMMCDGLWVGVDNNTQENTFNTTIDNTSLLLTPSLLLSQLAVPSFRVKKNLHLRTDSIFVTTDECPAENESHQYDFAINHFMFVHVFF